MSKKWSNSGWRYFQGRCLPYLGFVPVSSVLAILWKSPGLVAKQCKFMWVTYVYVSIRCWLSCSSSIDCYMHKCNSSHLLFSVNKMYKKIVERSRLPPDLSSYIQFFLLYFAISKTDPLKIYFAGSINGGLNDTPLYARLIQHLKAHGKVLTEVIGNPPHKEFGKFPVFSDSRHQSLQ